jgi:hypothetical protein
MAEGDRNVRKGKKEKVKRKNELKERRDWNAEKLFGVFSFAFLLFPFAFER